MRLSSQSLEKHDSWAHVAGDQTDYPATPSTGRLTGESVDQTGYLGTPPARRISHGLQNQRIDALRGSSIGPGSSTAETVYPRD